MNYFDIFKTAFLIFPVVSCFITIPFILIEYHKYGSINKLRFLIIYSFILYLITIYFLVILPLPSIEEVTNLNTPNKQLIPFKFVIDFIRENPFNIMKPNTYIKGLCHSSFYTVVFNVFMTIPFGMYLRYYFKMNLKKTIKYSFLLSLFFELTQLTGLYYIYPRSYRLFDVDDLMMNTLGGVLGYYITNIFSKLLPTRDEIDKKTFESAQEVSGFRRITLFCLDMIIFMFIYFLVYIIIGNNKYIKYLLFFIYFVIIPYFWNGFTFGSHFLNVSFYFSERRFFGLIIKSIIPFIYYIFIPFNIICFLIWVIFSFNFNIKLKILSLFGIVILLILYYLINVIYLIRNKRMFYDKFSKVKYKNTLLES